MPRKRYILRIGLSLLLFLINGCVNKAPIRVGLAVELTGGHGELGVDARDAALLAVDHINAQGGIAGRPLELLVRNDRGDPEVAQVVDAELVEEGVVTIIGHITSGQTAAVFEQMNAAEIVLFSPTASSSLFTGQADYFFRIMSNNEIMASSIAKHIYQTRQIHQVTTIYDVGNRAFTETYWQIFRTTFEQLGGDAGEAITFESGVTDLKALMTEVVAAQPEALLFISSAVDTALMIQYARQMGLEAPLFSSTWAQTKELLEKGGRAIEGLEMIATYNPDNTSPEFVDFVARFESRYQRQPGVAATYVYELMMVLTHALEQTQGRAEGLPDALSTIHNFQGIQGLISIDEYGDVQRDIHIATVSGSDFHIIGVVPVQTP